MTRYRERNQNDIIVTGGGSNAFIYILLACALVALSASVILPKVRYTQHAQTSHAEQIAEIERCFNSPTAKIQQFKLSNGRFGQYCRNGAPNGYWRILTCERGDLIVITQFKQALRKLTNYLTNHEMVPLDVSPSC